MRSGDDERLGGGTTSGESNDRPVAGRTAILVTGMHRNGTSALARTLSLLGAALPSDLVPPNEGNPHGHWEPQGMVDLNDRMLGHAGSDLYGVRDIDPAWFRSEAAAGFVDDAERLVRQAFGQEPLVVLKDPRTALLASIWNSALARAGFRVVHVLPLRPPAEVAESLRRRHLRTIPYDAWPTPRGEAVWLRYTLAAVRGSRGHTRAFVNYGSLLADWRSEIRRLGDELGIAWPALGTDAEQRIDGFLHDNDRATARLATGEPRSRTLRDLDLPALAEACYDELVASGDSGAPIDDIHAEFAGRIGGVADLVDAFEGNYPLIWRYYEEGRAAQARLDLSVEAENRLRDQVRESWAALTDANNDNRRMVLDAGSRDRQIESLRQELARLEAQVGLDAARVTALEAEAAHLRDALAQRAAEREARRPDDRAASEEARRRLAEMEARLDAILRSTSWRVTAPLRALSRAVRGRA